MDTSDPHIKILTSIGYICVQWALLELLVLHSIFAIVDMDENQGDIVFGGLDIQPRLNTALNLAKHHGAPESIIDQIKSIRKAIQGGLSDKRNMAIHGVHADSETPDAVKLHMPRWGGPKKNTHVSIEDLHQIGLDIQAQADDALKLFLTIGEWKFGGHRPETGGSDIS